MFSFFSKVPSNQNAQNAMQLTDLLELSSKEQHLRALCLQSIRLYRLARRNRMMAFKEYINMLPNRGVSGRSVA